MSQVLRHIPKPTDPNLLVGLDTSDDAAVYRLSDDLAVIQTLDFFTPMVDDPYLFGQIAAANSLSDVYAMGGRPILALNITCFPNCLPIEVLGEILRGGADKVVEAGASIVGGHTVEDDEPKYGLSVTGLVHPQAIWANAGAKVGDILYLTKPIGSGIISTGIKADIVSPADQEELVNVLRTLNRAAADAAREVRVNGCTDITGFGFLGHALELARASNVGLEIWSKEIPLISGARQLAEMGIIPAGAYRNRDHVGAAVSFAPAVPQAVADLLFDPQTSGGLLLSVAESQASALERALADHGVPWVRAVGRVVHSPKPTISVG